MKIELQHNSEFVIDPSIGEVMAKIQEVNQWSSLILTSYCKSRSFSSQLNIIVQAPHGVVISFCPQDGGDEFLAVEPSCFNDTEIVETFDGGDSWLVMRKHFCNSDTTLEILESFIESGDRVISIEWEVNGVI